MTTPSRSTRRSAGAQSLTADEASRMLRAAETPGKKTARSKSPVSRNQKAEVQAVAAAAASPAAAKAAPRKRSASPKARPASSKSNKKDSDSDDVPFYRRTVTSEFGEKTPVWGLEGNLGVGLLTILIPYGIVLLHVSVVKNGFLISKYLELVLQVTSELLHFDLVSKLGWLMGVAPYAAGAFPPSAETAVLPVVWDLIRPNMAVFGGLLAWICWHVFCFASLPGQVVMGQPQMHNKQSLPYKLNGKLAAPLTFVLVYLLVQHFEVVKPAVVIANLPRMAFTALLIAILGAFLLYFFPTDRKNAKLFRANLFFWDFWMGTELNPRLAEFDIKFFMESRPGLIGWGALEMIFLLEQYNRDGAPSPAMGLVVGMHMVYILDYFFGEEYILTTMDIMTERFGFMLFYGDLAFVPFTFIFQPYFLFVLKDHHVQWWWLVLSVGASLFGYYMFRASNAEKHEFRTGVASAKHFKSIPTARGTKLLVDGWWGMMRKPNYTGDWLQGLGWCMLTGYSYAIPYFYAFYFAICLIQRAYRDHHVCLHKYGDDWKKYCKMVPHTFIPGLV